MLKATTMSPGLCQLNESDNDLVNVNDLVNEWMNVAWTISTWIKKSPSPPPPCCLFPTSSPASEEIISLIFTILRTKNTRAPILPCSRAKSRGIIFSAETSEALPSFDYAARVIDAPAHAVHSPEGSQLRQRVHRGWECPVPPRGSKWGVWTTVIWVDWCVIGRWKKRSSPPPITMGSWNSLTLTCLINQNDRSAVLAAPALLAFAKKLLVPLFYNVVVFSEIRIFLMRSGIRSHHISRLHFCPLLAYWFDSVPHAGIVHLRASDIDWVHRVRIFTEFRHTYCVGCGNGHQISTDFDLFKRWSFSFIGDDILINRRNRIILIYRSANGTYLDLPLS